MAGSEVWSDATLFWDKAEGQVKEAGGLIIYKQARSRTTKAKRKNKSKRAQPNQLEQIATER